MEEIHSTIKSMNSDNVAGPDGFNGCFFSTCWEILKYDLHDAITLGQNYKLFFATFFLST